MQNTKGVKELITKSVEMGDTFQKLAVDGRDINAAKQANQSYANAIKALQLQVMYKKLMGKNLTVEFLEDAELKVA
jgi:hypothetical protein